MSKKQLYTVTLTAQAVHAAAATLASLDDVRRGAVYGVRYHEHLARMMSEVTP